MVATLQFWRRRSWVICSRREGVCGTPTPTLPRRRGRGKVGREWQARFEALPPLWGRVGWGCRRLDAARPSLPEHRQVQSLLAREVLGDFVAGVGVAHDAGGGIVLQYALQTLRSFLGAVADDDHARMLGEAHADAA